MTDTTTEREPLTSEKRAAIQARLDDTERERLTEDVLTYSKVEGLTQRGTVMAAVRFGYEQAVRDLAVENQRLRDTIQAVRDFRDSMDHPFGETESGRVAATVLGEDAIAFAGGVVKGVVSGLDRALGVSGE